MLLFGNYTSIRSFNFFISYIGINYNLCFSLLIITNSSYIFHFAGYIHGLQNPTIDYSGLKYLTWHIPYAMFAKKKLET